MNSLSINSSWLLNNIVGKQLYTSPTTTFENCFWIRSAKLVSTLYFIIAPEDLIFKGVGHSFQCRFTTGKRISQKTMDLKTNKICNCSRRL